MAKFVTSGGAAEDGKKPDPTILRSKEEMRSWSRACRQDGKTVALVPTMGYLHDGHLSLVRCAATRGDKVVVSVYVNEGQFAPGEDLDVYPRDPKGDLAKLAGLCDAIFMPEALYSSDDSHQTWIEAQHLQQPLCGGSRPIFFRGVATVVAKLFNIVEPDIAVFGKKDYQQWLIVRRMVQDLDFPVEVVGMPLLREEDGLAMSSRNVRLSAEDRTGALSISRGLTKMKDAVQQGAKDAITLRQQLVDEISLSGGDVDYVEVVDARDLQTVKTIEQDVVVAVAARYGGVGGVRLIDNMEMSP
ncbi:hypothetical protein CYMTET_4070 [Cymbomonas tetramitiformis]|uniref:Pantoate--beta-alanine ligase n=1 Tax=Cymbomonas tetramitiformis TaxID=36881 RepID=A0AAE0LKE5_9CHLO|nr:hypothetical protein CYMTET_4070 [Cymbomonas tetramitiformis]